MGQYQRVVILSLFHYFFKIKNSKLLQMALFDKFYAI